MLWMRIPGAAFARLKVRKETTSSVNCVPALPWTMRGKFGEPRRTALGASEAKSGHPASGNFAQELKTLTCIALRSGRQRFYFFLLHLEKITFCFVNQVAEGGIACHTDRTFYGNQLL